MVLVTGALMALAVASSQAGEIDVFCTGMGDRYVDEAPRARFGTAIRLRVAGGSGQALVPDAMLQPDDARGWHTIKNLSVSAAAITGKIDISWLFAPVMSYDRATGVLKVSGSLANFSGTCRRFDAQTSRMPKSPGVQATAPATGIRSDWATPSRPPVGATAKTRSPGSFVLAKYKGGANWYPAQVMRAVGNLITVQYASGIQESLPAKLVYDLTWKPGSYIECKLSGTTYTPVTIAETRPGYAISVVTDQGKSFAITMRVCRSIAR